VPSVESNVPSTERLKNTGSEGEGHRTNNILCLIEMDSDLQVLEFPLIS
jgi:hypothetical protein